MNRSRTSRPEAAALLTSLALAGCQPDEVVDAGTCDGGEPLVAVVQALSFAHATDGVSTGFDLDGRVSDDYDDMGCGIEDYTDPEGTTGIDNGFARLLPALELTEFAAVQGLIYQAIASGELMIIVEITGLDDLEHDDCVTVTLSRADGTPSLGTDGLLESGQTLERNPDVPTTTATGSIEGGRLVAGPVDLALPLQVFDVSLNFAMTEGALRVDFDPDGNGVGVVGGAVEVDYILSVAATNGVDDRLVGLMETLMGDAADLKPNEAGECTYVSTNFDLVTIPAYLFD